MTGRPPNFVLFITDQHRADFLGCYGHKVLRTPQIDAIAARGTCFDRFYVASPVCMPNRATLMTGRMPSLHGVRSNGTPLHRDAVTFVDLLRDGGYRTALIGKSHLQNFSDLPPAFAMPPARPGYRLPSPDLREALRHDFRTPLYQQEEPGFWARPGAKITLPFYGFSHVELVTGHGDAVGGDYRAWLRAQDPAAEALLAPERRLAHDYACPQAHRTAIPPALYSSSYIAARAVAYLHAQAAQTPDQPFFLMVSFPDPHHPFNPPGAYWDMYRPEQFAVPEAFARQDWVPPPHVQAVHAAREAGTAQLQGMNSVAVTAREAQEARALTAGMVTCLDDAIGRVMEALRAIAAADTVVMFTADHGDHLGDHRLLLKGAEQYQGILRVPMIWSDPAQPDQTGRSAALGSTIDIGASILDRARIMPSLGMQGISLAPALRGAADAGRREILVQYDHQRSNPALGGPPRVHSLLDGRYRLSLFRGVDWGELYDLANDPGEFDNLWDSDAHTGLRAALTERLARAEIDMVDHAPAPTRTA